MGKKSEKHFNLYSYALKKTYRAWRWPSNQFGETIDRYLKPSYFPSEKVMEDNTEEICKAIKKMWSTSDSCLYRAVEELNRLQYVLSWVVKKVNYPHYKEVPEPMAKSEPSEFTPEEKVRYKESIYEYDSGSGFAYRLMRLAYHLEEYIRREGGFLYCLLSSENDIQTAYWPKELWEEVSKIWSEFIVNIIEDPTSGSTNFLRVIIEINQRFQNGVEISIRSPREVNPDNCDDDISI